MRMEIKVLEERNKYRVCGRAASEGKKMGR